MMCYDDFLHIEINRPKVLNGEMPKVCLPQSVKFAALITLSIKRKTTNKRCGLFILEKKKSLVEKSHSKITQLFFPHDYLKLKTVCCPFSA